MNLIKPTFFVLCLVPLIGELDGGTLIDVSDHGVVPGRDVSLELNQLLASIKGKEGVTLSFPEGQYEFHPENAFEAYRAVTNHDNSLRRMALPIFGFKQLTIDGNGSTFMCHGRISPVIVEGCEGTTLRNFSIDWKRPFHSELVVVERMPAEKAFVVEIDPEAYPFSVVAGQLLFDFPGWQDEIGQNVTFDPQTSAPIWNSRAYGLKRKTARARAIGGNRVRLERATPEVPPVGAIITTYGNAPTNRLAQAIHIANSKDSKISGVTVHAAGGMALIAERCENVSLDGFIVTSTDERTLSTRADATHFLGCKGLVELENCRFEHMADDGINVHGAYIKVEKYLGNSTFLCEISHRQQWGLTFAGPGDEIMITSRETLSPLFKSTVTEVEVLNEKRLLLTVSEMPDTMPAGPLSIENLSWYPDVVMRNNVIRDNRARSALISTKGKVLIEGNTFSSQMHGILIEGDNKSWYESGGVRDVTIVNNTFENIGYGANTGYPLYASPMLLPEQGLGDEAYHRNIRFSDNHLKSFNGHLVHGLSVQGLTITGNRIESSSDYPNGSGLPAIELDDCRDVVVRDNDFVGFERPLRLESTATTELEVSGNAGLFREKSAER